MLRFSIVTLFPELFTAFAATSMVAVSYTHLDVYKRQVALLLKQGKVLDAAAAPPAAS